MKMSFIAVFTFLLAGCGSMQPKASLTAEQARTAAMQLANAKANALYHCQPFQDGQPVHFMQGRWMWTENRGLGQGDIEAVVELAADGSTNSVKVEFLDNRNQLLFGGRMQF
ncbi:MAG TPA: hypothetical protein VH251_04020 [Verrucomicrobiae bacterium]|nr:hypothetical protein [Verrucomicrobiae bacterium]